MKPSRSSPCRRGPAWRRGLAATAVLLAALAAGCSGSSQSSSSPSGSNPGGSNPGGGPGGKGGTTLPYESVFAVQNDAAVARTEVIQAAMPFPEGKVASLENHSVQERSTSWRVLQRWPDGTVRVGLAQFADTLEPGAKRTYQVVSGTPAYKGPFVQNPWVASLWPGFQVVAEVKDVDGVPYYATLAGEPVTLEETPLVRTRRFRGLHFNSNPKAGIGRDFLSLTVYVTEFQAVPVVQVDLILGNDYLGADDPGSSTDPNLRPLGDVYVKEFNLAVANHAALIRYAAQNRVGEPYLGPGSLPTWPLLRETYLGDAQTKRWTAMVLFNHPGADPGEQKRVADTWAAMAAQPLRPLASLTTWRGSRALGLFGAILDPPGDVQARAEKELRDWLGRDHFGPFGSWGDTQQSGTTGTPRNAPLSPEMMHIVQSGYGRLVDKLEGLTWQQACRPYHMWGIRVLPESDIYLWEGLPYRVSGGRDLGGELLGRKKLQQNDIYLRWRAGVNVPYGGPHGWNAYDNEHWTTDLLFDYWTLTGDSWALDEMRQLGECAMGLLRGWKYATQWIQAARCEGWMLMSAVQIHLATGEERLKAHFLDRLHRITDAQRQKGHASRALAFQGDYPGTHFPTPHKFYMPWQHGPVLLGHLAAARFWQDSVARTIAEEVVAAVEYAWLSHFQDPQRGLVPEGLRYYVPVEYQGQPVPASHFDGWQDVGVRWGDSPLGGAHTFLIAALFYLSDMTENRPLSDKAARYGRLLLQAQMYNEEWRWLKWTAPIQPYHVP